MSVPEQIGRIQIRERIGSGGFATVWHGYDTELDADVAVKILAENWVGRADIRTRFVDEARLLRRADSDRVVRVHDIGTLPDGRPYFVMSYADAGTLADRLTHGPLPVYQALYFAEETAHGVGILHNLGILHRDVKPSNVLFRSTPTGERTVIADLGLAKALANASGFTVAAGTPGYMAPEQSMTGGGLDKRVDVYALGALTYQMVTGRQPPSPNSPTERLQPPSHLRTGLPPGTDTVVTRALARDRDHRWPDATSYATALHGLTHAPSAQPIAPAVQPPWNQLRITPGAPPAHGGAAAPGPARPAFPAPSPPAVQQQPAQASPRAEHPSFPGGRNDPTVYPGGQPERAKPRLRSRTWLKVVGGACVLAILAGLGTYYAVNRPTTVQTHDKQIVVQVPDSWAPKAPSQAGVNGSDFGGSGKGLQLSTQTDPLSLSEGTGITVVAGRGLHGLEAQSVFTNSPTSRSWLPSACPDSGVDSTVIDTADEHVTLRTWTSGSCATDHAYGEAYVDHGSYGVEMFMVADKGQDPFNDVVRSLSVDGSSLPK